VSEHPPPFRAYSSAESDADADADDNGSDDSADSEVQFVLSTAPPALPSRDDLSPRKTAAVATNNAGIDAGIGANGPSSPQSPIDDAATTAVLVD
jgi:hypothetical protein